jgi:uncharacterized damage-inducible protein DinB
MIKAEPLAIIFQHHLWANLRLFEKCGELTAEQLDSSIVGVFGSIRETLIHIVGAERGYFSRISTGQRYFHRDEDNFMTLAELITAVRITGEGFNDWAIKVQADDTVEIDWDGTLRLVPKTIILNQVINHATEHRSQVMSIMTQIGVEPPDVSSWSYYDEMDI